MTASGPPGPPYQQPPPGGPPEKPGPSLSPGQILGIILLVLMIVFIAENTAKVKVRILIPQLHVPLFIALIISAALGSLGTLLIQWRRHRKR